MKLLHYLKIFSMKQYHKRQLVLLVKNKTELNYIF